MIGKKIILTLGILLLLPDERIPLTLGDAVISQSVTPSPKGYCIASTMLSYESNPIKKGRKAFATSYPCKCDTSSCKDLLEIQRDMVEPSLKTLKQKMNKE